MDVSFVFAGVLRRVVYVSAAPAFLAPGIAVVGGVEERFQRGDAGGYDADVLFEAEQSQRICQSSVDVWGYRDIKECALRLEQDLLT